MTTLTDRLQKPASRKVVLIDISARRRVYHWTANDSSEQEWYTDCAQEVSKVLEDGNKQLEAAGGLTLDAAGQYEKLGAQVKNLGDAFSKWLEPAITPVVAGLADYLQLANELNAATETGSMTQKEVAAAYTLAYYGVTTYGEAVEDVTEKMDLSSVMADDNRTEFEKLAEGTYNLASATGDLSLANEDLAVAAEAAAAAEQSMNDAMDVGLRYDLTEAIDSNSEALDDLITKLIWAEASENLSAEGALALARELGILDEASYATALGIQELTNKYDVNRDGVIDATEDTEGYIGSLSILRDMLLGIESKYVELVMNFIVKGNYGAVSAFQPGGLSSQPGFNPGFLSNPGIGMASGGAFDVPSGYSNDSFGPMWLSSGEHVSVTPAGQAEGGNNGGGEALDRIESLIATLPRMMSNAFRDAMLKVQA